MAEKDEEHINNSNDDQQEHPEDKNNITGETESVNSNQAVENMEVHHHAHHTGKKNWKSYFWEFLMLFLAVFCGFLAEYQLEHKIERDRAKELASSFYQELKNDSITAATKVQNRIKQEDALQYLIKYFRDSSLTNASKSFAINFVYGISFRSPSQFEPRTIILDQLKSSGSLRYFKDEEFQRLTGDLTVAIKNVYDRQELESQNRLMYINPLIIQHYDYAFDAEMKKDGINVFEGVANYEKSDAVIPYHINGVEKLDRQNTVNVLSYYCGNIISSTRQTHIQKYIDINAELMRVLRKEYHLK